MGFSMADVIGAAIAWWQDKQKSGGNTPNFYPAPLTPEEKYWDDAKKKTFEGSPTRDYITGLGTQFLGQLDTQPKNHSFLSDAMKGQTYGAGFVAPKFDLSKLPSLGGPTGPGVPKRPGDPGGPGVGGPGGRDIDPANDGGDPLNPRGGNGPFGPDPGGLDRLPTNLPTDGPESGFADWFAEYRRQNPDWWKKGVAAVLAAGAGALGVSASVIANWLKDFMTKNNPNGQPLPGNFSGDFGPSDEPLAPPDADVSDSFGFGKGGDVWRRRTPPPPAWSGGNGQWAFDPSTGRWVMKPGMLNPTQPIFGGPSMQPGWGQPSGGGGMGRASGDDGSFGYSHPDAWVTRR